MNTKHLLIKTLGFSIKNILAREWLILLGCLAIALPLGSVFSVLMGGGFMDFFLALAMQQENANPKYFWRAILVLFAPYLLVQLYRLTLWAFRNKY